ncbi:mitochondrial transcription rescue factor 1 [Armigeres subalbatus]|uniref:mitochondrial transcription rescue factor 1 n=1 Tax=Armigeres subalbatus TaxID=124917 RepID=UPI002ED1D9B4
MSFLIRGTMNRGLFRSLRNSFPLASYCSIQQSVRNSETRRSLVSFNSASSITLHNQSNLQIVRWKSKKSNRKEQSRQQEENEEEDDDDEKSEDFEDLELDKHVRLVKTSVNSMRADVLLKAGLGIARNKVETLFYESKIRVNGKKLLKKSSTLEVGDELDVVRGVSPTNEDHLIVSRVEVLAANPKSESIGVSLRRQKTLIIEDYDKGN